MRGHRDLDVGHAGALGRRLLIRLGIIARQVDDGFDSELLEILVVAPFRLSAAIESVVDASEIVDPNGGRIRNGSAGGSGNRSGSNGRGQSYRGKKYSGIATHTSWS